MMAIPWRWQSTELGRSSPYLATLILPPVVSQEGAVILSVVQATQALWFPVLIWGVLLGFFLAILFAVDEGLKRLRQLHQVPCDRCRFNSANPYLLDFRLRGQEKSGRAMLRPLSSRS
jgi:hypothetical protein